jgi:hypothetical protein
MQQQRVGVQEVVCEHVQQPRRELAQLRCVERVNEDARVPRLHGHAQQAEPRLSAFWELLRRLALRLKPERNLSTFTARGGEFTARGGELTARRCEFRARGSEFTAS